MLRSCDYLFKLFLDKLPTLDLDWHESSESWTKKIIGFFSEIGKEHGYDIYPSDEQPEYLVDHCWYVEKPELGFWAELALEHETSYDPDEIVYDFAKLCDLKAYIKVGIFYPKVAQKEEVLNKLKEFVAYHAIKIPHERYLTIFFLHYPYEKETRKVEVVGYEINYLGETKLIGSQRFSEKLQPSQ